MNNLPPQVKAVIEATEKSNVERGSTPIKLEWKGTKIPRGLSINGVPIAWTQHGIVTGENGQRLGTYKRLVEFGGPNHDEHVMLVVPSAN